MKQGYAEQYGTPVVIVETGDKSEDVIKRAREIGAETYEGPNLKVLVLQFCPDVGPECYSPDSVGRTMRTRYVRPTSTAGVNMIFFTEDSIPDGPVTSFGGSTMRPGVALTVAPIKIAESWFQVFHPRCVAAEVA